jgi:hypothetical protein
MPLSVGIWLVGFRYISDGLHKLIEVVNDAGKFRELCSRLKLRRKVPVGFAPEITETTGPNGKKFLSWSVGIVVACAFLVYLGNVTFSKYFPTAPAPNPLVADLRVKREVILKAPRDEAFRSKIIDSFARQFERMAPDASVPDEIAWINEQLANHWWSFRLKNMQHRAFLDPCGHTTIGVKAGRFIDSNVNVTSTGGNCEGPAIEADEMIRTTANVTRNFRQD